MKKLIVLMMLLFATSAFGCDVCGYYFNGVIPYVPASSSGWWTGVALTNATDEVVTGKLDVIGEHRLISFQIEPHSIEVFNIETESNVYINVSASGCLYVTNMLGNDVSATSILLKLKDERE